MGGVQCCCKSSQMKGPAEGVMTGHLEIEIVRFDLPGLKEKILAHLADGKPILAPCPSPGPYAVIGPSAAIVGKAKGRSAMQLVARMVGSFDEIKDLLQLDASAQVQAKHYLEVERMTCLLPVKDAGNPLTVQVIEGGVRNEEAGFDVQHRVSQEETGSSTFALFWKNAVPDLDAMCSESRPLYVSSGNLHGLKMGQSFQEVVEQFQLVESSEPIHLLAIDGDHLRTAAKHESTSMVRISCNGDVKITREGYHHLAEYAESKLWRLSAEESSAWSMTPGA